MSVANSLSDAPWTARSRFADTSRRRETTSVSVGRSTPVTTAAATRVRHRVSGRVIALLGSLNILLGELLADPHRTARGHRQRVIGVLQSNCEVDRRVAGEFVDRWMSKHPLLRVV